MLDCQRDKFNLENSSIYLNCAYMSPLMRSVEESGYAGLIKKRMPTQVTPEDFFKDSEELRKEFGKLINTSQHDRIVIIPSVSYGMANVAHNLSLNDGQNIVVVGEQFPSNYYPWKRKCDLHGADLRIIRPPESFEGRGKRWNELILEAIDEKTRMVALPHVHWADGTKFDLKAIRKKTRDVGAWLAIDGTQSVGALPFNIDEIQPDALVCAGYKWLMGPYSIGLAYYGQAFDEGIPVEENWINRKNSEDFAGLVAYEDDYQPGALRYEVGEHSNFILVPMLLTAIKQINDWGVENIQQYCKRLISPHLEKLKGVSIESDEYRGSHLFGIRLKSGNMEAVKQALSDAKISVSVRGDAIRVSPHVYNTEEEFIKLVELINKHS